MIFFTIFFFWIIAYKLNNLGRNKAVAGQIKLCVCYISIWNNTGLQKHTKLGYIRIQSIKTRAQVLF